MHWPCKGDKPMKPVTKPIIKKCTCGKIHYDYSELKVIGSNEVGIWVNCTCGSTLLILG